MEARATGRDTAVGPLTAYVLHAAPRKLLLSSRWLRQTPACRLPSRGVGAGVGVGEYDVARGWQGGGACCGTLERLSIPPSRGDVACEAFGAAHCKHRLGGGAEDGERSARLWVLAVVAAAASAVDQAMLCWCCECARQTRWKLLGCASRRGKGKTQTGFRASAAATPSASGTLVRPSQ